MVHIVRIKSLLHKGFSLVELLVVVAIIGVLSAIGLLNLRTVLAGQELQTSSEQLISQIRTMQQISLNKSPSDAANLVNISFTSNSCQITNGTVSPAVTLPTVTFPSSVALSGSTSLTFDAKTPANNDRAMVTVTSTSGSKRTLVIAAETGRIRLDTSSSPAYRAEE